MDCQLKRTALSGTDRERAGRRHPPARVGKFAAKDTAGCALEPVDDLSNKEGGVSVDEPTHIVWRHRHHVKRNAMLAGHVAEDLPGAGIVGVGQRGPAESRAEVDVVVQAENGPGVHPITPARSPGLATTASRVEFERGTPIGRPVFLCQLKPAGSNRSFL